MFAFGECVQSGHLLSGQAHGDDLHGLCASARSTAAASLEGFDVVARFGLVDPLLDLLLAHLVFTHGNIVNENIAGERSWWRTVTTHDGTVIGIAIPSATPTNPNVGYVAVLPEHRGNGYVDTILSFITRFHAENGAQRTTATTDLANPPMAAAFHHGGYQCTEARIDLEPSTTTTAG